MQPPIFDNKNYHARSIFTGENLLRETKRLKSVFQRGTPVSGFRRIASP
jgi:hypothetical protein